LRYLALFCLTFLLSCTEEKLPEETNEPNRLEEIRSRGVLRALIDNSSSSYFIYKGQPMGFEYELLKRYADHLGTELEIQLIPSIDSMIELLNRGSYDLVAANLTVTRERKELLAFTEALLYTRQVLVQAHPEKTYKLTYDQLEERLVRNLIELANDTVHVLEGTAFRSRLENLSDEIGEEIVLLDPGPEYNTELLVRMVSEGKIKYTVADENQAKINKKYFPNIDIRTPISFPQQIAWATSKNDSEDFLNHLNAWIADFKKSNDYASLKVKYFQARTVLSQKVLSDYSSLKNRVSVYDELIKENAEMLNWDWRLLAAQVYQESKFDPDAESWNGAKGLMQLIESTAKAYGADSSVTDPSINLKAGSRYLLWLNKLWKPEIEDEQERIKFILASFNVGLGHILDARALTTKNGGDASKWDGQVEQYLMKKSLSSYYTDPVVKHGYCRGSEPVSYVREILERYQHYKNRIEL